MVVQAAARVVQSVVQDAGHFIKNGYNTAVEAAFEAKAAEFGIKDLAGWAASKSVEATSNSQKLLASVLQDKLKGEFGEEALAVFQGLTACLGNLNEELQLTRAKFGLMLALPLVRLHDDRLPPPEKKADVDDSELLNESLYWLGYAQGAYGVADVGTDPFTKIKRALGEKAEVVVASLPDKGVLCPGHFVAVDAKMQTIVLGVRGTTTTSDALTDAVGESVDIDEVPGGLQAHKGVLASARAVLERTRKALQGALADHPKFRVVVTGHSLGAGVAILCAILLKANPLEGSPRVKCWAFAPPPVVSPPFAELLRSLEIYSFINRYDCVPRASLHNVYQVGAKAMAVDQMDLSLIERLQLIVRKAAASQEEQKSRVVSTVSDAAARCQTEPGKFAPLFVPGRVFWISQPQANETGEESGSAPGSTATGKSEGNGSEIYEVDAVHLQSLLLAGGSCLFKDHACDGYAVGLQHAGAAVDVEETAKRINVELLADQKAKSKKCCSIQ